MSGDVIVHLSGTKEMSSNFMINVQINSFGEEHGDSRIKVQSSLWKGGLLRKH